MKKWWQPQYKIVEVEKPRAELVELTPDLKEGLKSLAANPFFGIMLERLRAQRYALETRLKQRFANLEEVGFVQNGVFWTGWLEREMNRLTADSPKPALDPIAAEIEAFRAIDALLERVGDNA